MEGRDGERRLRRQHAFEQAACALAQRLARDGIGGQSDIALLQQPVEDFVIGHRRFLQQPVEPCRHFLRRLAGEGDREARRRRRAVEQQPEHARDEQPGLAAAGTGGDDRRVLRIQRGTDQLVLVAHRPSPSCGTDQWSRLHRPRMSQ